MKTTFEGEEVDLVVWSPIHTYWLGKNNVPMTMACRTL